MGRRFVYAALVCLIAASGVACGGGKPPAATATSVATAIPTPLGQHVAGRPVKASDAKSAPPTDQLLSLPEWKTLVQDERLQYPFALAYTSLPWFRPMAQVAAQHRITLSVDRRNLSDVTFTPKYKGATCEPRPCGDILLSEKAASAPPDSVAALLVRYVFLAGTYEPDGNNPYHTATPYEQNALSLLETDALAYGCQAYYQMARDPSRISGDDLGFDTWVSAWRGGRVRDVILAQQQSFSGTVTPLVGR